MPGRRNKIPSGLPGHSFCGLLDGRSERFASGERFIYVFDEYGPVRMIRGARYKYVHRYPYGENEFYDLLSDPGERLNLIGDTAFADAAAGYRHRLELWFTAHSNPEIDGSREAVTGFGQLGLAGTWGSGKETYRR